MKRVNFCEQTQVYYPFMHGEVHWIQKEPLTSEEDMSKRCSCFQRLRPEMKSTLRLSQTLRKAAYSDMKKQQREERLQSANAAWQDMDTDTQFVVLEKLTNLQSIFVFFLTHNVFKAMFNKCLYVCTMHSLSPPTDTWLS